MTLMHNNALLFIPKAQGSIHITMLFCLGLRRMAKCVKWLHSQTEKVEFESASLLLQPLPLQTPPVTAPESSLYTMKEVNYS